MKSPIIVDNQRVDEETLTRFINDVQRMTGAKVTVRLRSQWVVETENYPVSLALQTLLGGMPDDPAPRGYKPTKQAASFHLSAKGAKLHAEYHAAKNTNDTQGGYQAAPKALKSWSLLGNDGNVVETMTVEEKNKALAEGRFAEGAILRHPKAGKQRVIGAGPGQGMEPVQQEAKA